MVTVEATETSGFPEAHATGLAITSAYKSYGATKALRGVSFSAQPGEIVCLLGENGAGKSTLSKILAGVETPDRGTITLDGEIVDLPDTAAAHQLGIRAVPQELILVPELTVAENIMLGELPLGRLGLVNRRAMRHEARKRLQALSLGHLDVNKTVQELRVVDQAFVQIARALTPGTRFLIADEPTAPMSGAQSETLLSLLSSVVASGVGVIFVSHRLDEVFRIGHRVCVLRDGQNALDQPVPELSRRELVRAMAGTAQRANERNEVRTRGRARLVVKGLSAGLLREVDMTVHSGEVVGVYGGAGSGREDLGPALFGATRVRAGTIRVDGNLLKTGSIAVALKCGIGYVPAERRSLGLLLERSVADNLTLATLDHVTRLGFIQHRRERQVVDDWWARLDVKAGSPTIAVGTLSGGNQQKVLLARWLEKNQSVLVLDEPTRGVDVRTKAEIYRILREAASRGVAVAVVSSDPEELELVADRVLVLREGLVGAELGAPSQSEILHHSRETVSG